MKNEKDMIKWLNNLKSDIGQPQHSLLWHYAEILDVIVKYLESATTTDCISRQAAIEAMAPFDTNHELRDTLESLPPVEPKRSEGEWISNHDGTWNCSNCGLRVFVYAKGNFCPNCGADMRGEK